MKKPSERRADASAWLPLRVTLPYRLPPCPEGQVGMSVSPNLNADRMVAVQCVLVNENESKTLLFCCRYATRFHTNFLPIC